MCDQQGSSTAKVTQEIGQGKFLVNTGEILDDKRHNGEKRPWKLYKSQSLIYAAALKRLEYDKKAERVINCGSSLWFKECILGHEKRLESAYFCKSRLCMMCMWRRSLRVSSNVFKIVHTALDRNPTHRLIFLTLTIANTSFNQLQNGVDVLLKGWDRLTKRIEIKRSVLGYFRALETSYNTEKNTWHPHIHALLIVPSNYFSKNYIKRDRWLELWQESTKDPSITQVDIRAVKSKETTHETLSAIAAEAAKYAVKPSDEENHPYIRQTERETDEAVIQLINGLKGRRLTQFGGLFRVLHRELNLTDGEEKNVDLVHIENEQDLSLLCSVCGKPLIEHLYKWDRGIENYIG